MSTRGIGLPMMRNEPGALSFDCGCASTCRSARPKRARRSRTQRRPGPTIGFPSRVQLRPAKRSSRRAASAIRISRTCAAALRIAVPLFCIDWLPAVKPSSGVRPVSAVTSSMSRGLDLELLGGDLDQRGPDALAELRLAGEDGDRAVGVDADPGVEEARVVEAARAASAARRGRRRFLRKRARQQREADDQRAGAGKHAAARGAEVGRCAFISRPSPRPPRRPTSSARAARCTALRMRDVRAAAAEIGFECGADLGVARAPGFACSSACARIIMPGMQ